MDHVAYQVSIAESAAQIIDGVRDDRLAKKITKCLGLLESNPRHPGLASHRYVSLDALHSEKVWESYVENRSPSAWRIWWFFGPDAGEITVVDVGPHP